MPKSTPPPPAPEPRPRRSRPKPPQEPDAQGTGDPPLWLKQVQAEIRAIADLQQTMIRPLIKLDGGVQDLAIRIERLRDRIPTPIDSITPVIDGDPRLRSRAARSLHELARSGVDSIDLRRNPDDTWSVRVQGGKEFMLPSLLGQLLQILADPGLGGESRDELIAWRSKELVLARLKELMGRTISARALANAIYRLRQMVFARGKCNPCLIASSRHGYRFALRRAGAAK